MISYQVILFFIVTGTITTNNAFISSDFQNALRHTNDKLLEIADEVFMSLKINVNFTKSENVADSLLLNNFIRNVSARNYKKYDEIHDLSTLTVDDNKTAYFIFIINEMVEEFVMLEKKKLKHRSVKYYKNNLLSTDNSSLKIPETNSTINLVKLKNEFSSKLKKSVMKDVVYKLLFANPKKSLRSSEEQDLKLWEINMSSLQTRRVFNGQATSVEEFPFIVSVHIESRFSCAGSIIRKELVITAASCLRPFHTAQRIPHLTVKVRVASNFTNQYGELIPVVEMYFHPHFNHESLSNNLAILRLKKRLKFSEKVRKIMFDNNAYKMPENAENILILGWGSINMKVAHHVETTPLSYAFVDVYNLQECKKVYSSFYVKDKNFCTGYVSKGSGACKNDIGGPAVVGSTLAGVISYGSPHCGQPDAPTVYTKLGYYADWIRSIFDRIPQENNHVNPKSRLVTRPRNGHEPASGSVENSNKISSEIESLSQLIGELQIVKHINSTIMGLKEKQMEEANIHSTKDKDDLISDKEDNDIINVVNVLQYFNQDSVSTTPESIDIPVGTSDDEHLQNQESAVANSDLANSKESEEATTHQSIFIDLDNQFKSGHLDTKSSLPAFAKSTANSEANEFTLVDEWPHTRFDSELLKEMTYSHELYFENDTNDVNNSEVTEPTPNYKEFVTSNAPIASRAEQKEFLQIVFLRTTSVKEMTLPKDLPILFYESSRKNTKKSV